MKTAICFAVFLCIIATIIQTTEAAATLVQDNNAGGVPGRYKRASCWAGEAGCATHCWLLGRRNGGCCGQRYTRCHNTCYCNGSGFEHRCYSCDL